MSLTLDLRTSSVLELGELQVGRVAMGAQFTILDYDRGRFGNVLLRDSEVRKLFYHLLPTVIECIRRQIRKRADTITTLGESKARLQRKIEYWSKEEKYQQKVAGYQERLRNCEEKMVENSLYLEWHRAELEILENLREKMLGGEEQ